MKAITEQIVHVKFENVGGSSMCWEETLPGLEYRTLLKAVQRRGAICSRHPDFSVDEHGNGLIYAGFRCVGKFTAQPVNERN